VRHFALFLLLGAGSVACSRAPSPPAPNPGAAVTLLLYAPAVLVVRTTGDSTLSFREVRAVEGRVVADTGALVTLRLGRLELANGQSVPCPGAEVTLADSIVERRSTSHGDLALVLVAIVVAVGVANLLAHGVPGPMGGH